MNGEIGDLNKINNILIKIRSKYIVIEIFNHLRQNRLLKLIQYNKMYQKIMNKKLKDYKNEFSKIEIEIILKENTYGKFIDVPLNKNIHIYFNDNKEEIKKKRITKEDNIKKIKIIIDHKIRSLFRFFFQCKCIQKINFIKFNNPNIKNMGDMFSRCSSLEEINLSNFNSNNAFDISGMFFGCSSLKELNLSNFNTNNVVDISAMFIGCSSLKELNLSNFKTNKANDMSRMFFGCSSELSLICENDRIIKEYKKFLSDSKKIKNKFNDKNS